MLLNIARVGHCGSHTFGAMVLVLMAVAGVAGPAEKQSSGISIVPAAASVPPGGILPVHVVVHEGTSIDTLLLRLDFDPLLLQAGEVLVSHPNDKLAAQNATESGLTIVLFGGAGAASPGRLATLYLDVDPAALIGASLALQDGGSSAADSNANAVSAAFTVESVQIAPLSRRHSSDSSGNGRIELGELLRSIQLYNAGAYFCGAGTEDGFALDGSDRDCAPHSLDFAPQDWQISLTELLRGIQLYNAFKRAYHDAGGTEDGFAPGPVD